jgi:serine O-acetyltransferase
MKKESLKNFFYFCILPVYLPLLIPWWLTDQRTLVRSDLVRWRKVWKLDATATCYTFLLICMQNLIFRTIFYHRLKCGNKIGWFLSMIFSQVYGTLPTLKIFTKKIGPGLFIQHGYCTILSADSIGKNAWINQGVTIGYTNDTDCPTIGDNVIVSAGAKILGKVQVGNNVKVGANAVVIKNVPDNCTVVGVPAYIVRRNGLREDISL